MEAVDPSKQARFCNSFCAATQDIAEGLSASRSTAADGHWMKWDEFCQEIDLDPLLVLYRDPVPIFNTFVMQYWA